MAIGENECRYNMDEVMRYIETMERLQKPCHKNGRLTVDARNGLQIYSFYESDTAHCILNLICISCFCFCNAFSCQSWFFVIITSRLVHKFLIKTSPFFNPPNHKLSVDLSFVTWRENQKIKKYLINLVSIKRANYRKINSF